jgi:hypothetical protein
MGAERAAFYFGSWGEGGHLLHDSAGHTLWRPPQGVPHLHWTDDGLMDGGLLANGRRADVVDGRVFWTVGGPRDLWPRLWHAFYWWDRSGDPRSNSNSGFYVWGFEHRQEREAFAFACETFPEIVTRQAHPLVLQ